MIEKWKARRLVTTTTNDLDEICPILGIEESSADGQRKGLKGEREEAKGFGLC